MNRLVGSGIGSADVPPPQHQQMEDVMGLSDPMLLELRNNYRQRIIEYARKAVIARLDARSRTPADWQRRLPELAWRVEKVLFEKHPNKREYYNMTNGPVQTHFEFAVTAALAQIQRQEHGRNQQMSRQRASPTAYAPGGMIPAPGVTQGEAPNEHVNTVLSLGINSSDAHSEVSNSLLAVCAPVNKEVSKEPKFSCPFCFDELVDASSTNCGHIFCLECIKTSIQAQNRCPACWRALTMNSFHRVYLPATMD
ncbi:putative histone acetyltransferase HAC-like 1 [Hordeum vulgare]|uniref:RING-type domain-containing protein n=1 Tax=Hordeum vulgare subsp. vulgare TaxID=112509 RepID=A0A8I6WVP5_HORVV|nr:probable histone acetyltransferase HAC-like 1 [Hordeum vulgare subsp. vulgare]KAE8800510.1 putative histone acetyltransferase HAC-like 1 [Hordeum vulgare]